MSLTVMTTPSVGAAAASAPRRLQAPAPAPAVAVPPSAGTRAAPAPAGTRAMWLWNSATAVPAEVLAWARDQGVTEIFAYAPANLPTNSALLTRMRELKRGADTAGIRLTALGGEPEWATDHTAARTWQRAVLGTGLFAGSHVDVEPYALPAWQSDQAALAQSFVQMLQTLQADSARPLEADVPFWYGEIPTGTGTTLADQVLAQVNGVTVMSYRDTATGPNSMTDIAADVLTRGSAAGRPVRLGAETGPLEDCPHCTFAGEEPARVTTVLAEVDAAVGAYAAFNGIAVHHYESWRTMGA
ncbi:amidase [Planomonospora sphaerica]|uniref:Amidase n=2 Tax=Planomonospora sphaerica TaxID=161355 RepID=A0A171CT55_9ACTN|nr:amidase [Planomonospora sphaerica]